MVLSGMVFIVLGIVWKCEEGCFVLSVCGDDCDFRVQREMKYVAL